VIGGRIAARIAGLRSAEPAMLHGGLAGSPAWSTAAPPVDPESGSCVSQHRAGDRHRAAALASGRSAQPDRAAVPAGRRPL